MTYSQTEKYELIQYLAKTQDELLAAVSGLSEAQLNFQVSSKRWSIAGIVEHITLVEDAVIARVLQELTSAPNASDFKANESDASLLSKATNRSVKLEAPTQFHPTGKLMSISCGQFLRGRNKIVDFVQSTDLNLRQIPTETRAFGVLDGHQRLLFLGAHCARHTQQIIETKSNPNFPAH